MPQPHSVHEAYTEAVRRLSLAGVASPEAEAWQLVEAATGLERSRLITDSGALGRDEQRRLGEWLARRELREPLQLILGRAPFYGLEIPIAPGVLVPRPETERLVEMTLERVRGFAAPRILDVGTGSGAVALAIKSERPDAIVEASEIDESVLRRARENAAALDLEVVFRRSDLLDSAAVRSFAASSHVVVSNPPYLPAGDREMASPEVRWDPPEALYAGEDGLVVFRRLMAQAHELMSSGSLLIVELDPRNVELAKEEASAWAAADIHADLAGRARFLELRR
ncbi:MAG TPA: peptide chain release factor N(5)-glutamine methyltransferase [Trueperaceae bacterium]